MTQSYYGTTSGSTLRNPPNLLYAVVGGQIPNAGDLVVPSTIPNMQLGGKVWFYSSTNAPSDMTGAQGIIDGGRLGMKNGDLLIGVCVSSWITSSGQGNAYPYLGILVSSETSVSTAGFRIATNYTT